MYGSNADWEYIGERLIFTIRIMNRGSLLVQEALGVDSISGCRVA